MTRTRWVVVAGVSLLVSGGAMVVANRLEASIPVGGFNAAWLVTRPMPTLNAGAVRDLEKLVIVQHTVRRGETIFSIAKLYGTDFYSIQSSNNLKEIVVSPGQTLVVPNRRGMVMDVPVAAPMTAVLGRFERSRVKPEEFLRQVVEASGLSSAYVARPDLTVPKGTRLFLPKTYLDLKMFDWPFQGINRISSRYGRRFHPVLHQWRRHAGWDIAKPYGTPVRATRTGRVVFAGERGGYGKVIILKHPDGFSTYYGHLSEILVSGGASVKKDRLIGKVGATGMTTGPHLHYEVRNSNDRPVNPGRYLY